MKRIPGFYLGFVLALTLLAVVGWFNWCHISLMQLTAASVAQSHKVQTNLNQLLVLMGDIETGSRGFVITGDPVYLEPFDSSLAKMSDQIRAVRKLTSDNPRQQSNCDELEPLISQRIASSKRSVAARSASGLEAARKEVLLGTGKAAMDQIRTVIARMIADEETLLSQRSEATRLESSQASLLTVTGLGLSCTLLIGVFMLVLREKSLRQKAQLQRDRFFDLPLDLLCIAGMDGYFKQVNAAFSVTLGYSNEEILAKPFIDLVHPEDLAATRNQVKNLCKGNPTILFENRYLCKDGTWRWLSWKSQPFPTEGLIYSSARDVTDLKHAEKVLDNALQEIATERARFKFIFDSLPVGVSFTMTDAEGRRKNIINEAHLRICGISSEQAAVEGMFKRITPPEDYARQSLLSDRLEAGEIDHYSLDKRYIRPDGKTVWVIYSFQRRMIAKDSYDDLSIVVDITSRKEVDEELRRSEENLAVTLNSIGDGVLSTDADGCITGLNAVAQTLTGWSEAEAKGRPVNEIFRIINEKTREPAVIPLDEVMHTGEVRGLANHTILITRDGRERSIADSAAPIRDRGGRIIGAVLVFRDVTEEARLATALRENENLMRAVLNSMIANIAVLDGRGTIIACNEAWSRFARENLSNDALPGVSVGENYLEVCERVTRNMDKDAREITNGLRRVLSHPDAIYRYEYACDSPTEARWFAMHSSHLARPEGGAVVAHINTTDRKLAEVALRNSQERLGLVHAELVQRATELEAAKLAADQANQAKSEYLSRMSHELRTPLNAILGFGQLLEGDVSSPEDVESVDQILKAGRHLLEMINELLDIARIEAGRMRISPEPVLVSELLKDCVQLIRPLAEERHIQMEGDFPESSDQHVLADRQRIKQVVLNLLSNAIKYNRNNGRVTLSCELMAEDQLRIKIQDTGAGITHENMSRLFSPFERLESDYPRVEGTGLGLALSKRLIELMGGKIGVESNLGEGSLFWIELSSVAAPIAAVERALLDIAAEPPPHGTAAGTQKTVLYIEDNLSNMRLIERILSQRSNVKLIAAMQGNLGLDLARQHVPDLILLDLNLPDIPGLEVLLRLRAEPGTSQTPVIIISADATPGEIERVRAAGARDYLTKPFNVGTFLRVLNGYLSEEKERPL